MVKKFFILKKTSMLIVYPLTSILFFGLCLGTSRGMSGNENTSALEGAKLEGRLVLYTTQSINDSSRMVKKFEDKYPFLKVELYRAPPDTLLHKIVNEAKARKYIPDVIELSGFYASVLKKERLTTSYISPEYKAFPEGFKDPDGNWTSTYLNMYLIGYNTKLLSRKEIPETFEGFLHPRWKGKKIGFFDIKEVEWFANILKIMGEEKGMDFLRKLAGQELCYRRGMSLITDLIIAGEFPVGTVFAQSVENRKKKGAPVDWVGVAPVIAKLGTIGLAANAPHPRAARLYIDFCLSKEGQTVLVESERIPARPDIEAEKLRAFRNLKIYPSDLSLADKFTSYSKQFAEVLKLKP